MRHITHFSVDMIVSHLPEGRPTPASVCGGSGRWEPEGVDFAADLGRFFHMARATSPKRQPLTKFAQGQQSVRMDKADILAEYFGIEVKWEGK